MRLGDGGIRRCVRLALPTATAHQHATDQQRSGADGGHALDVRPVNGRPPDAGAPAWAPPGVTRRRSRHCGRRSWAPSTPCSRSSRRTPSVGADHHTQRGQSPHPVPDRRACSSSCQPFRPRRPVAALPESIRSRLLPPLRDRNLLVTWRLTAEGPSLPPCLAPCHDPAPSVSHPGGSRTPTGLHNCTTCVSGPRRIVTDSHRHRPYGKSTFGQLGDRAKRPGHGARTPIRWARSRHLPDGPARSVRPRSWIPRGPAR